MNKKKKEFVCITDEEVQERIQCAGDAVETIEVYTDLSGLYPDDVGKDLNLVIIDTPGTDSARGNDTKKTVEESKRLSVKSHIEITKDVLKSKQKEMVILVSDDKLEDDNIVDLLNIIEESAESDDGAFNDRFLFVMNMCDSLTYSNKGETLDNYIRNFVANIQKVPNSPRMRNIVNPRVFPISSGVALAVANGYTQKPDITESMTKKEELYGYYEGFCKKVYYYSPQELEGNFNQYKEQIMTGHKSYKNYCLEHKSSISEAVKREYSRKLAGELSIPERIFIHSGVPALKCAIQDYIRSYAYPIKVRQLLNCFKDILEELCKLNAVELEVLNAAKKDYSSAVTSRERAKRVRQEEEKRKILLQDVSVRMNRVNKKIEGIKETITEINGIVSAFFTIKNSIADEVNGRREVPKDEGEIIIKHISSNIDLLCGKISDTVRVVKVKKKEATEELYQEFLGCIRELEAEDLMRSDGFLLKDTVAYKQLVDKSNFTKPVQDTKKEKNLKKEHIVFGYGIDAFFDSIPRAWKTRKEPEMIKRTYINIEKYIADNINPIEALTYKYEQKLREDYKNDIINLKTEAKKRVDAVIKLIEKKREEISKIELEAYKYAANERQYGLQIEKLEARKEYLDFLISRLSYTQI